MDTFFIATSFYNVPSIFSYQGGILMYQKFKPATIASMVAESLALLASGKAKKIAVPLDPHWTLDLRSQNEPFPATVVNLQVYFFDGGDPTDSYNFVDSSFVVLNDATYVAE